MKRRLNRIIKKEIDRKYNIFCAYIVARKLNQQCDGCSAEYHHFKKTNLKRCLSYHKWISRHHKNQLSDLYFSIQTKNKRRYSPELIFNAFKDFKKNHPANDRSHPIPGGEHFVYTSTASVKMAPRIYDGRIISVDLCKEEN